MQSAYLPPGGGHAKRRACLGEGSQGKLAALLGRHKDGNALIVLCLAQKGRAAIQFGGTQQGAMGVAVQTSGAYQAYRGSNLDAQSDLHQVQALVRLGHAVGDSRRALGHLEAPESLHN